MTHTVPVASVRDQRLCTILWPIRENSISRLSEPLEMYCEHFRIRMRAGQRQEQQNDHLRRIAESICSYTVYWISQGHPC